MKKKEKRMADIIISDTEFIYAGKMMSGYLQAVIDSIFDYGIALYKLSQQGLSSDMDISKKLEAAFMEISEVMPPLRQLKINLESDIQTFITEIDEADEFIY